MGVKIFDSYTPARDQTHAMFCLAERDLEPSEVTRMLGIEPDRAGRRGDWERINSFSDPVYFFRGLWVVYSTPFCASEHPNDHLEVIVDRLYPALDGIKDLVLRGIESGIWVVHCRRPGDSDYSLRTEALRKVVDLVSFLSIITRNVSDAGEPDAILLRQS